MTLKIAISPCPNDTFVFHALLHGLIDTQGLSFDVEFADIEELNRKAREGEADVCKVSYGVLPQLVDNYALLPSGSALGRGNGPLLVRRDKDDIIKGNVRIAIPGIHTTANQLLTRYFPKLSNKFPVLFSEIAGAVSAGEYDGGVLIHEGRFTYRDSGLELAADLGRLWEEDTSMPLPLGGIVAKRELPDDIIEKLSLVISESVIYAIEHPEASRQFVKEHAQEMDDEVIKSHISLFVNEYTTDLGMEGITAVEKITGLDRRDMFIWQYGG